MDESPFQPPATPPRPARTDGTSPAAQPEDTVVMYNAEIFGCLGIQSIPRPEFEELAALISSTFGIRIGENKITLVTGRMHPMMEKYCFKTHRDCLEAIKNDSTGELISELANRISTNHTAFYREDAHFQLLQERVLPEVVKAKNATGNRDLRVWCAACATGEEAYTILFTLIRYFQFDYGLWRAGVLATDISAQALDTARAGRYDPGRLEPVPRDLVGRFFNRVDAATFEVKPEFRSEVTFRRLNLMNDRYPFRQPFDIIFCRNVMIYFSRAIRLRLLRRLHDWLVPGGYLFIGHSESLVGGHHGYDYVAPALYRRAD
ncbi:MAG: chemotaxis protein CheR [Planctomycetes bacterium]|nr:chemotaxis protein CheR [Planctomycetota bacterium]